MNYYILAIQNYVNFKGRATNTEYWNYFFVNVVIYIILLLVAAMSPFGFLYVLPTLYNLFICLPDLGAAVRRLHDTNKSGWYLLVILIPIIGIFVYIYLLSRPTVDIDNRY